MKNIQFTINTTSIISLNFIIWGLISCLYSLQLSDLLNRVDIMKIYFIGLLVPFMFFVGYLISHIIINGTVNIKRKKVMFINLDKLLLRTKSLSFVFSFLVLFEFLYSGYVPLFSMINGSEISHFDFGISSLHGLIMSIGALLFTTWFFIYYLNKNKIALIWIIFILVLFALMVTRKMMVVSFIQALLLVYLLRTDNKIIFKFLLFSILGSIVFGIIGDIRTGREIFISLSQFTVEYPEWLPTGFGWIYIYVTTPIANFVSAMELDLPLTYDFTFLKGLLPSVIRSFFFEQQDGFLHNDWQISSAFNVSTGFIDIYLSFGIFGVMAFNFLLGFVFNLLIYKSKSIKFFLITVMYSNIILLLLFTNNFFNLNTVSQLLFAYLLFGFRVSSNGIRS